MINILIITAGIGGFIKIVETTIKIITRSMIFVSNYMFYREMDKRAREFEKEEEEA